MATTQRDKAPAAAPASNGTAPELSTEPIEATPMSLAVAAALRAPFEPGQVGKLPRIWCGDCRKASGKVCSQHSKGRCNECNQSSITTAHMHLDYVGHAATTDRLLKIDPLWTWEPLTYDVDGLPAFDRAGGLWIKLTVAGVTRLGYGDQEGGKGSKEVIGDAIRNAAMRFGVALDLWSRQDLQGERDLGDGAAEPPPARTRAQEPTQGAAQGSASAGTGGAQTAAQSPDERPITQAQRGRVWGIARDNGLEPLEMHEVIAVVAGVSHVGDIPRKSMDAVTESFVQYASDREAGAKVIAAWREQHAEMAAELDKNEATRLEELAGKDEPDPAEDDAPGGSYDS